MGLLLPTLGRTDRDLRPHGEQCVSTEDSSGTVRASRGIQKPISERQRSEPAIVAQLAQALGCAPAVPWARFADDYAALRERIERCQRGVTDGFERYNERLMREGRFVLPNPVAARQWRTESGRAEFRVHPFDDHTPLALARRRHGEAVLALMTVRAHDQFNTTVYSADDRYRGIEGDRRVVFLNPEDLAARSLADGDRVDVETLVDDGHTRRVSGWTARARDLPRGCCAAYYPEANALIAGSVFCAGARTPLYKEMPVRVDPHRPDPAAAAGRLRRDAG